MSGVFPWLCESVMHILNWRCWTFLSCTVWHFVVFCLVWLYGCVVVRCYLCLCLCMSIYLCLAALNCLYFTGVAMLEAWSETKVDLGQGWRQKAGSEIAVYWQDVLNSINNRVKFSHSPGE